MSKPVHAVDRLDSRARSGHGDGRFLQAVYLELKADDVGDVRQRIVAFGVNLSKYEGTEHGQQNAGRVFG